VTGPIVVPVKQGTPEWLAWRRGGYGSSDVPILLNGDEKAWRELHAIKLNILPDPDTTEAMTWGRELEQTIARAYAAQTGEPVQKVPFGLQHPEIPAARASLDRRRRRGRVIVELKAWGFKGPDFGPAGSDQVPEGMYGQVQQQLAVTGYDRADLAVFFGSSKQLLVYRLGRDGDLIDSLLAIEASAWAYVSRGTMPPWPGPAELRPRLRQDEIPATEELTALVLAHAEAAAAADRADVALKAVKDQLRQALQEVGGTRGQLPDGRRFSVAHRPNKDSTSVAWEQVAAGYRRRLEALGTGAEELDFPLAALTTPSPGVRPLRVTIAKEAKRAA
jgi:putative phage-type endonuclease